MRSWITSSLLLTNALSFGQWIPVNVNSGSTFVDVQFVNDSVGFITGTQGAILKTEDYGLSWINANNTGNPFSTFRIHFPGDSLGYALGGNSLYKTVDQGLTWFALPAVTTWDKANLFFINDSTGFFLASYGVIFKTTDGGMNWINNTTTCGATIVEEDIYFAGPDTGYFCGWYTTCVSRTTDGGATWQAVPNNLIYLVKSIHFPSATTGYIAGANPSQQSGVEKTTDGGNTWVLQNAPVNSLNSIYCADTTTCYAVGPGGVIIKTTDGGATWQQQYSGTPRALRKVYCVDSVTCFAVGDSGTVLKTVNGGVTGLITYLPDESRITISPNPVSGQFTIHCNSPDLEVEVYNAIGEKITGAKNQKLFDVSAFSEGIYFIKVVVWHGYSCHKIIVAHD